MKAPISADLLIDDDEVVLRTAVDETCAGLIDVYHLDSAMFAFVADIIAQSILQMFQNGQRNPTLLAQHAIATTLKELGHKYH